MNQPPDMLTQDGANTCAVYVGDDVLCVGRIEMGAREGLRRVAYRDVARMAVWEGRRQHVRIVAWVGLAGLLAIASITLVAEGDGGGLAAAIIGAIAFSVFSLLMWRGRLGGVTRFRVETARAELEGVLGGSQAKRERILSEIERRIRERQASR